MPELPELEVVREVLLRRVIGQTIDAIRVAPAGGAIVIRDLTHAGFVEQLTGARFRDVSRRGKFLVFTFASDNPLYLVVNPKLTGRFQLARPPDKPLPKTHIVFALSSGDELRYVDQKRMGQLYLTRNVAEVPDFARMGPDALAISFDDFRDRLYAYRGEIKGILTRGEFVAGIGNAYADEILWNARLHPFRKRTQLTTEEIERLYKALRETLRDATEQVRAVMGEQIHLKPREFLAVHMKGGEACPRCGTTISHIGANPGGPGRGKRITNFCRHCQPGGLIRGM